MFVSLTLKSQVNRIGFSLSWFNGTGDKFFRLPPIGSRCGEGLMVVLTFGFELQI